MKDGKNNRKSKKTIETLYCHECDQFYSIEDCKCDERVANIFVGLIRFKRYYCPDCNALLKSVENYEE